MRIVWPSLRAMYDERAAGIGSWMLFMGLLLVALQPIAAIELAPVGTALLTPDAITGTGPNCTNVRNLFEKRQISSSEVPNEPINGKSFLSSIYL